MTALYEHVAALAARPSTRTAMQDIAERAASLVDEAARIQQIPAPTFDERARAEYAYQRFSVLGLSDTSIDEAAVVYGRIPGSDNGNRPAVMVSAHLDTVFPAGTDLSLRHQDGRVYGPGLGDNSVGAASLLTLAEVLTAHNLQLPADVWLVGTVGEEGLGNLRGMRRAIERLATKLGVVLVVEGMALGHIFHRGLGVRRLRVTVNGPGGHSWMNYGRPSAINCLMQLGVNLDKMRVPSRPVSSLNIGLIEGGTSINSIALQASMAIDLRSEDSDTLANMESRLREIVEHFETPQDISVEVEIIGERPAAQLSREHPLVKTAGAVLTMLGMRSVQYETASTDANIPLAEGLAAVCLGITTGGEAHSNNEYINTTPIATGLQQLLLLTVVAAHQSQAWTDWRQDG